MHDGTAYEKLSHSVAIGDVDLSDVNAIFMAGGHGACDDFINQPSLKKAIETMYNGGKVVSSVCHGQVSLTDCVKADGSPLVSGKKVTGFSNTEEEAVQLTKKVPFLLEDKLKELGAEYSRADDWNSKVVVDVKLVTGQNPQSSAKCAEAVVSILAQ